MISKAGFSIDDASYARDEMSASYVLRKP